VIDTDNYTLNYELFKSIDPCRTIKVVYTTGGWDASLLKTLKIAVLNQVAYLYTNRGDEEKKERLSPMTRAILNPKRRVF
jgi:hypothetical protein